MIFNEIKQSMSSINEKNGKFQKQKKNKTPKPNGQYLNEKIQYFLKNTIFEKKIYWAVLAAGWRWQNKWTQRTIAIFQREEWKKKDWEKTTEHFI